MNYRTVRDVNFGGTLIPAGRVFQAPEGEESEATIARLLEKGSIVEFEGEREVGEPVETTVEPTQEQLERDFQEAGVEGSPNVPQPN